MFKHILTHDNKGTHISLIGMYFHMHNNNTRVVYITIT